MKKLKLKLFVRKKPSSLAPTPPTASPATTPTKSDDKPKEQTIASLLREWGWDPDAKTESDSAREWREKLEQPHPPTRAEPRIFDIDDDYAWPSDPSVRYYQPRSWAATKEDLQDWTKDAQHNVAQFIMHYSLLGVPGIKAEYKALVESYVSPTYSDKAFRANPTKNENNDAMTCLDDSRVKLADKSYINASWACDNYGLGYILAQKPNESTYEDFWHLVYEHRAFMVLIVYETDNPRIRGKADFWPMKQEWQYYGKMAVLNDKRHRQPWMHTAVADLEVTKKGRARIQLSSLVHVTGVANNNSESTRKSTIKQLEIVNLYQVNQNRGSQKESDRGPVIFVDADGGCGLASVMVLADMMGRRLFHGGKTPSLPALAQWLRRCRHGAIRTADEYLLVVQTIFTRIHEVEMRGSKEEFKTVRDEKEKNEEKYKEVRNEWFNKIRYEKEYREILGKKIETPKWPTREEKEKEEKERKEKEAKEKEDKENEAKEKEAKEREAKDKETTKKVGGAKEPAKPSKESALPSKEGLSKSKDGGSKEKVDEQKKK